MTFRDALVEEAEKEVPSTKLQAPKEGPNLARHGADWSLELGSSLELGTWNLERGKTFDVLMQIAPEGIPSTANCTGF